MDIKNYYCDKTENPLDHIPQNGGFTSIFRTIACIGDSLSSGEFQVPNPAGDMFFFDEYDYSWGQFMARTLGSKVYNFSCGGMTAQIYWEKFANEHNFFDPSLKAQAYLIALGVNDVSNIMKGKLELGDEKDIITDSEDEPHKTFIGYYTAILSRYRAISPNAKFFLMTCPHTDYDDTERSKLYDRHQSALSILAERLPDTYLLDLRTYAPYYDIKFRENFQLFGHLSPTGYRLTADMIIAYIDYIIRKNPNDFKFVGLVGSQHEEHIPLDRTNTMI